MNNKHSHLYGLTNAFVLSKTNTCHSSYFGFYCLFVVLFWVEDSVCIPGRLWTCHNPGSVSHALTCLSRSALSALTTFYLNLPLYSSPWLIFKDIFNYICICGSCPNVDPEESLKSSRNKVKGGCEPPNMGTGNLTQILCKSSPWTILSTAISPVPSLIIFKTIMFNLSVSQYLLQNESKNNCNIISIP